jgi:hypothetical protein
MFFLKSLLYTIFSPKFYGEAVKKGAKKAWGVFFLFTILTTIISFALFALGMGIDLLRLPDQMEDIPEIRVENGELSVEGADMPIEIMEDGSCIFIDTTQTFQKSDIPRACDTAFLLERYTVTIRTDDSTQDVTASYDEILTELNRDSIVINQDTVSKFIQSFGLIIVLVSPVFIFIGQVLSRLFMILLITILGLIVLSIMKKDKAFKNSFILAVYASIPVFYINLVMRLLRKVSSSVLGVDFVIGSICCLLPLILSIAKWGVFWGIGAFGLNQMETSKAAAAK